MFKSKKDVDSHVKMAFSKIKCESERNLRGFTIAKLYYKVNEYETACHYISQYLSVKDDSAPAYKLLGLCYQHLKNPQKALEAFQRSLQLDPKQPEILVEVCKLFLSDSMANSSNLNKAKYWCDLAESEKIQDDAVLSLRLKLLSSDKMENKQVEELILKEINTRPNDPNLRARLVKHFIEQNKIVDAFKYVYEQEIKYHDIFASNPSSAVWYDVVLLTLNKFKQFQQQQQHQKQQLQSSKNWEYWLLLIICLERQVELSFSTYNGGNLTEISNLLFNFDQYLYEISKFAQNIFSQKEFAERFLTHFRGQFCLHAASLIFKREQMQNNKNQWRESTKNALPLLMFAFQCGTLDLHEPWIKHCENKTKQLIQIWNREGAFRCSQAARTLLSCVEDDVSVNNEDASSSISLQVHQVITEKSCWANTDELLSQVRSFCSDVSWRSKIFRILFANSDQIRKMSTSFLINSTNLREPMYELPSFADTESYEEISQYLRPQSLQHMVYLCLGVENLSDVRCKYFNGLHFSTQNLSFCGSESLNQLDIETFLYAAAIQAKRLLDIERQRSENYNSTKNIGKPKILPFVNMTLNLCSEEQKTWWTYAYQVYRNHFGANSSAGGGNNSNTGESLGEIRTTLQYGIEAVRGCNGPKMDLMIILKLGKIFSNRCRDTTKTNEKNFLDARVEILYKHALNVYKLHQKGVLEPFRKLFTYANSNSTQAETEMTELCEEAVTYLASRYFKNGEYEECIDEFSGIQLPFATYFQAEAYRKLDESNKTPKKTKKFYLDKARDCLDQTANLLNHLSVDINHPLNSIIHSEIKRLQFIRQIANENTVFNGNSHNRQQQVDFYMAGDDNSYLNNSFHRSRRESSPGLATSSKLLEFENLTRQIMTTLTLVKDEIKDMRKEFQDKLVLIEENLKKKSQTPSRDDASNVLEDLYLIGDEIQNQGAAAAAAAAAAIYGNQSVPAPPALAAAPPNLYSGYIPHQQQHPQRIHTPNPLHPQIATHLAQPVQAGSPWYPADFFTPPQFITPAGATYTTGIPERHFSQRLTFESPTAAGINFNIPPPTFSGTMAPPPISLPTVSGGPQSLFSMQTQQQSIPPQQQQSIPPQQQQSNMFGGFSLATSLSGTTPQQQQQQQKSFTPPTSTATVSVSPATSAIGSKTTVSTFWNRSGFNNTPVEKGPPVNVVITSSDPLPSTNTGLFQQQPPLSVTIPPQHIKASNQLSNDVTTTNSISSSTISPSRYQQPQQQTNFNFPILTSGFSIPATLSSSSTGTTTSNTLNFSPISDNNKSTDSYEAAINSVVHDDSLNKSENAIENAEYDPRPDFKPIIPLPDEVEVKTGEEDEEILFSSRAKLFRYAEKEWKERGIGVLKILKSKIPGYKKIRILMRRDQTHKICANHFIVGEMNLIQPKGEEKGYIWAAKDFADEIEISERFLVRFKQSDIAKQFYDVFTKARDEMKALKPSEDNSNQVAPQPLTKSSVFNFSNKITTTSAPLAAASVTSTTSFLFGNTTITKTQSIFSASTKDEKKDDKPSPFAGFSFDKKSEITGSTNESFANLFSNLSTKSITVSEVNASTSAAAAVNSQQKSTTSNNVNETNQNIDDDNNPDEFVPTAEFKPVISLPDLVEVQTGEENEIVLFKHRAKLFRFDKDSKQWKEKGIGDIKLLADKKHPNRVRLLMRREFTLKVCINVRLTKDMQFIPPSNQNTPSLQFGGKDFSDDPNGKIESFSIRFKTLDICKSFHEAIQKAQANMTKEDEGAATNSIGVAAGDDKENKKDYQKMTSVENKKSDKTEKQQQQQKGFGDQFKPKPGSWSCNSCYLSNEADTLYCIVCEAPKDDTVPKKPPTTFLDSLNQEKSKTNAPVFKFGFSNSNDSGTKSSSTNPTAPTAVPSNSEVSTSGMNSGGFGDKFKPKQGSWECSICYVSNEGKFLNCVSCNSPRKDNNDSLQTQNSFATTTPAAKTFTFGFKNNTAATSNTPIHSTTTVTSVVSTSTVSVKPFDTLASSGFNFHFENPNESDSKTKSSISSSFNAFSFKTPLPLVASTAAAAVTTTTVASAVTTTVPFSFTLPQQTSTSNPLSLANNDTSNDFKLEKKQFSFVLKPKSPGKAKSPLKNSSGAAEEESDGGEDVEEENNTYFAPVIPLPDKIDVKTGEEDEDILYCHRAKLYRYIESEWKERGIGDVKILQHKQNKKLRVVMRREQVLKICLNHALTNDVNYMRKDDKAWHFVVDDFSEGQLELTQFCIRFKTKEIAEEFMNSIKTALNTINNADYYEPSEQQNSTIEEEKQENITNNSNNDKDDAQNNRKLAEKLQLPLDFFEETNQHENCKGCRGCNSEDFVFPSYNDNDESKVLENCEHHSLPLDMSKLNFSKNITTTANPSPDTLLTKQQQQHNRSSAILKQSTLSPASIKQESSNVTNASSVKQPTPLFGGFGNSTAANSFGANSSDKVASLTGGNIFSLGDNINFSTNVSSSTSIFGGSDQKSIFGGNSSAATPFGTTTLFGSNGSQLFGGFNNGEQKSQQESQQKSVFGTFSFKNTTTDEKPQFSFGNNNFNSGNNNLFSSALSSVNNNAATNGNLTTDEITSSKSQQTSNNTTTATTATPSSVETSSNIFKDPGISFSDLATKSIQQEQQKQQSSASGFIGLTQNDAFKNFMNPQFQKSTSQQNNNSVDNSKGDMNANNSGAEEDTDTNYDPHYDPIIELPDKIEVVTGEENEIKLFGERATLFRFDSESKQWKERGVGELKILHHPEKQTYRLLMRREQIYKCVLNHKITDDFTIKPMNTSGKAFCWCAQNFAEEPQWEKLACRFKQTEIAKKFEEEINKCIEQIKNCSGDLEPEED